jgi:hypothetical protein
MMKAEAIGLLQEFYARGNPKAPKPHRTATTGAATSMEVTGEDVAVAAKKPRVDADGES